ncbi:MAG TPA: hypothetical protein VFH61_11590 [Thermoleophilia bacterium]|nr:hypothetical protein [Thermoleophilia bacterium]
MTDLNINADEIIAQLNAGVHVDVATPCDFETREEAEAVLARFPKSLRAFVTTIHTSNSITFNVGIAVNPVNANTTGNINEAAERRIRRFAQGLAQ